MTHHPAEETLHRLVDAELSGAQAVDVERHVTGCDACQATVARLERLRRAVARLPRAMEPPPFLAAAVQSRVLQNGISEPIAGRRNRFHVARWTIAAALIIAASGLVLVQRVTPEDVPAIGDLASAPNAETVAVAPPPSSAIAVSQTEADPDAGMLSVLKEELERQRHTLAPQTIATVEQNLRIIDAAIAATRQALMGDPSNRQLAAMLEQARRRRADYIRTAVDLTSGL